MRLTISMAWSAIGHADYVVCDWRLKRSLFTIVLVAIRAIRVGFVEMNPYDCGALGQSVNETRTLSYETTFDNAMS